MGMESATRSARGVGAVTITFLFLKRRSLRAHPLTEAESLSTLRAGVFTASPGWATAGGERSVFASLTWPGVRPTMRSPRERAVTRANRLALPHRRCAG